MSEPIAPRVFVRCACGCNGRVEKTRAVGINGQWSHPDAAHVERVIDRAVKPARQMALLLNGGR